MAGGLKIRVSQIVMIAVAVTTALLGLPYLFLHQQPSIQHVQSMLSNPSNSLVPPNGHMTASEYAELQRILSRAAMANKTVIITALNEAWAAKDTMIDLFLLSFRRGSNIHHLLQHLVIVTLDRKAHERCVQLHPFCFRLQPTDGVDFAGEKKFMTQDYLRLVWKRMEFLGDVLEMGYSFVFSDADILWFRDPFPNFAADSDFQIACDRYHGGPFDVATNDLNSGFLYIRSNQQTVAFFWYWYEARLKVRGRHDQDVLRVVIKEEDFARFGVKIRFLETLYFSGFCQVSKDMKQVVTMHANCCKGGLNKKLQDLQLALDDWQEQEKSTAIKHWRVPSSCRLSK